MESHQTFISAIAVNEMPGFNGIREKEENGCLDFTMCQSGVLKEVSRKW